jgi:hypothetical protein
VPLPQLDNLVFHSGRHPSDNAVRSTAKISKTSLSLLPITLQPLVAGLSTDIKTPTQFMFTSANVTNSFRRDMTLTAFHGMLTPSFTKTEGLCHLLHYLLPMSPVHLLPMSPVYTPPPGEGKGVVGKPRWGGCSTLGVYQSRGIYEVR